MNNTEMEQITLADALKENTTLRAEVRSCDEKIGKLVAQHTAQVAEIARLTHEVEYMNREIEERDETITELNAIIEKRIDERNEAYRREYEMQNTVAPFAAGLREAILFQCLRDYQDTFARLIRREGDHKVNALFRKEIEP